MNKFHVNLALKLVIDARTVLLMVLFEANLVSNINTKKRTKFNDQIADLMHILVGSKMCKINLIYDIRKLAFEL